MAPSPMRRTTIAGISLLLLGLFLSAGCTTPRTLSMRAERYKIEISLHPANHSLQGRAVIDLAAEGESQVDPDRPVDVSFRLHHALRVTNVSLAGASLQKHAVRNRGAVGDGAGACRTYSVRLRNPVRTATLFVEYEGGLHQQRTPASSRAPEKGQAYVSENGVLLTTRDWYPTPCRDETAEPSTAEFLLLVDPIGGMRLEASGEPDLQQAEETGRLAWRSPYQMDQMALVGTRHEQHIASCRDVTLRLHLAGEHKAYADSLVDALRALLTRYEPLLGPFPARKLGIVETAEPTSRSFPALITLPTRAIVADERGHIDEKTLARALLQCWWGGGILADPRDGDWSVPLTAYAVDHSQFVLGGFPDRARRLRRSLCHKQSLLARAEDRPLGTCGQRDGCPLETARHKGPLVFHMLARQIGQDVFWHTLRRLTAERMGTYVSFDDLLEAFEQESGKSLATFAAQWVRRGGAPSLQVRDARYDRKRDILLVTLEQGVPAYQLSVPIRVHNEQGRSETVTVSMDMPTQEVAIACSSVPMSVEIDPDYHVFRTLPHDWLVPNIARTQHGDAFATVLPAGDLSAPLRAVQRGIESEVLAARRTTLTVGRIGPGELAERSLLILGDAVRDPYVAGFLSAVEFPVRLTPRGFTYDGVSYEKPGHAVLCTIKHPGVSTGGITILLANSPDAWPAPCDILQSLESVVVYDRGVPVVRRDVEPDTTVPVQPATGSVSWRHGPFDLPSGLESRCDQSTISCVQKEAGMFARILALNVGITSVSSSAKGGLSC